MALGFFRALASEAQYHPRRLFAISIVMTALGVLLAIR
jgi:hypothetical protein